MDAVNILELYKKGNIGIYDVVDWTNVVWFTDVYEYGDNCHDSLAGVLNYLEELDEEGSDLILEKVDYFIEALRENREI